jgi:hypothetical protein
MPLTTSWGWATWRRAWQVFEWNPVGMTDLLDDEMLRSKFDLDDSFPYSKMLRARLMGENDSWAILWWYIVFKRGGLVLYPKQSLVWNTGVDGTGTHSGYDPSFVQMPVDTLLPFTYSFLDEVSSDTAAFTKTKNTLRKRYGSKTMLARISTYLKRVVHLPIQ